MCTYLKDFIFSRHVSSFFFSFQTRQKTVTMNSNKVKSRWNLRISNRPSSVCYQVFFLLVAFQTMKREWKKKMKKNVKNTFFLLEIKKQIPLVWITIHIFFLRFIAFFPFVFISSECGKCLNVENLFRYKKNVCKEWETVKMYETVVCIITDLYCQTRWSVNLLRMSQNI